MSARQLKRLPFYALLVVGVLTALVFFVSGLIMDGGFERAWEILLGVRSPFGQASGLGIALSALGYIAVPTVIGVAAGAAITVFTNERLTTVEEAVDDIRAMTDEPEHEPEEKAPAPEGEAKHEEHHAPSKGPKK